MDEEKYNHKFKAGDIVYVPVYLSFDYEIGKIIGFDDENNMYVMIHFLDNCDLSFWRWCYVKEEDIDFASKIDIELDDYKEFVPDARLDIRNYLEFYTEYYELAKALYEGKISREEYRKQSREIDEKKDEVKRQHSYMEYKILTSRFYKKPHIN